MDVQSEVNPYQSPGGETSKPAHANEDLRETRRIKLAWVGVFLLNMCVPVWLGWQLTEGAGNLGMFEGTCVLFVSGYVLCASARSMAKALVVGGVAIGLSQVFPALQMMAGIAGFFFAQLIGLDGSADEIPRLTNDAATFVTTIITGGLLMAAAFVAGLAIRALFSARVRNNT